jgi:hypothetical protein
LLSLTRVVLLFLISHQTWFHTSVCGRLLLIWSLLFGLLLIITLSRVVV